MADVTLTMTQAKSVSALQVGNMVAFLAVIAVNSIAGGTKLLNGRNTADVSAAFPTLVTPAGFTFSIWGVIYTLLFVFVVFQLLPRHRQDSFNSEVSYLFILSSVFNIAWLFLWQYDYITVSAPMILMLLVSLIAIYLRLHVGRSKVSRSERLSVHLPFSVYLGWITVASIANISSALVSVNWSGSGIAPTVWAQVVIVVALVITFAVLGTRRDVGYGLVIAFALVGIAANQGEHPEVVTTAETGAVLIGLAVVVVALMSALRRGASSVPSVSSTKPETKFRS
jgi:benzodiazapine receptor